MSRKPFKVTDHIYVPKHEVLSEKEAREVLKKYNVKPEQLPYILITDPVVQELREQLRREGKDVNPGDIIRITRKSETAGTSVYYRLVVEG